MDKIDTVDRQPVERLERPTAAEFRRYAAARRPVVIGAGMSHWKALGAWTPDYLEAKVGAAQVPVLLLPDSQPDGRFIYTGRQTAERQVRDCLGLLRGERPRIYMAGIPIAHYLPALAEDFALPEVIDPGKRFTSQFWISGAGSTSPLHYDLDDNIHALVAGRKRFLLFDYRQSRALYPNPVFSQYPNFSPVDPSNPDYSRYPRLRQASGYEVTLNPGEMLYIPVGCWHQVTTLEPCIAVNFWLGRHYLQPATLRILFPFVLWVVFGLGLAPLKALFKRRQAPASGPPSS